MQFGKLNCVAKMLWFCVCVCKATKSVTQMINTVQVPEGLQHAKKNYGDTKNSELLRHGLFARLPVLTMPWPLLRQEQCCKTRRWHLHEGVRDSKSLRIVT